MERVKMSEKEKEKYTLFDNDLLFARQSLVAAGAGKCSIVKSFSETTTFESHLIRVTLNSSKCNPWYYFYLFKLPNNPIKSIVNQCAQAGIRAKELEKIKVPFPKIEMQNRIADILSKYDELIEVNHQRIKKLEQTLEHQFKSSYASIIRRKKFRLVRIREIASFVRGLSYSSEEIECEEGINLINLKNIQGYGGFRRDGTKQYNGDYKSPQIVTESDLIMGVTDMTQDRRTVGSVALVPHLENTSVISADLIKIESDISNIFLYCLFRFGNVSKYIAQFANGANVLHLKPQAIGNIKIQLPDNDYINLFSSFAEPIVEQIELLNQKNDNLIKQRDLLLPRLMSGKLEI